MLEIRSYEDRDEAALVALLALVFPNPAPHNEPRASVARMVAFARDLLLVGFEGGRLVATATGGWDGHRGWLYQVAVAPSARRRGFGRAIVQALEARLRELGVPKVNLQVLGSNPDAVPFWEGLGYRIEDRVSLGKILAPGARGD